jgi:prepilin-type N-terminal cleavage/methylation domain-containing protein
MDAISPAVKSPPRAGFTLVELSIVLVIIGLIVGGILVGQDLITAARIRAQITQIDKYNTAVNVFRVKYNALPGDMIPTTAAALGFFTRSGIYGDGDGDGNLIGYNTSPGAGGFYVLGGETVLFWTDLSAAGLIEGGFNDNSDTYVTASTDAQYAAELPHAKIGNGNFVFADGWYIDSVGNILRGNGFQIMFIVSVGSGQPGSIKTNAGLTPVEAYNIDQKVDDGLPLSGKVFAMLPDSASPSTLPGREILAGGPTLCVTGVTPFTYNMGTARQSTVANCSLRFQAPW